MIVTVADVVRIDSIRLAAASITCSQLSNTSSLERPSNAAATLSATLIPACCAIPSTAAAASGTAAGSPTAANSITHTPSGKSFAERAATSSARRVLPTPPTPVSVSKRCALSAAFSWSSSACRPMKLVVCGFRLPGVASTVFSAGKSVRTPEARTWKMSTGFAMSRKRLGPNGIRSRPLTRAAVKPSSRI